MFEDALMESGGRLRSKNSKWTTIISFAVQAVIMFLLILIPLIWTQALPTSAMSAILTAPAPPPPPPPPPPPAPVKPEKIVSEMDKDLLRAPSKIPKEIKMIREESAPPSSGGGVFGGVAGGAAGGVFGGSGLATSAPKVAVSAPKGPQRVSSGVMAGNKISGADVVYPPIAKSAHISGHVIIDATISKSGSIENLQVVSGPPLLRDAALQAVRTYRYRPYMLSGEPVEVQTTIGVNFTFGGG
jgi:periplasmic protein TonB